MLNLIYLFFILTFETSKFYIINFFRVYVLGLTSHDRLMLIKTITQKLESINIVYVKIFQSMSLEKNILYENESDYLIKYTDSVPYNITDIDLDVLYNLEKEHGIYLENKLPVNSGVIGIVFKGIDKNDNNKPIVVKMLKNNIREKYIDVYKQLEELTLIISYIPYINNINYSKMLKDSKDSILAQTDFIKESNNIEHFKNKFKNNKEYIIPSVYKNITKQYNNVIVMSDIKGLTYSDIKDYDNDTKYQFARLLNKFGYLSILYHNCINSDIHAGNIFFYINNDNDCSKNNIPKYQLGIIDYGLCYYPTLKNQDAYFKFFYDVQIKKNYSLIDEIIYIFIENNDYYKKYVNKKLLHFQIKELIESYSDNEINITFINNMAGIFKKHNLEFTKEFSNVCMSIQISYSLGMSLYNKLHNLNSDIMSDFIKINNLLDID